MINRQQPTPPTIPLTQNKFNELVAEKDRLTIERKAVMQRLQVAREMGDLSENGAYHYAKFELGSIGRQLRTINQVLGQGQVTAPTRGKVVGFGSHVTLSSPTKTLEYDIVSEFESNPVAGRLSMNSPLGTTLMGKTVGDEVTVTAPAGHIKYTILAVS